MKHLLTSILLVALLILTACNGGTETNDEVAEEYERKSMGQIY